jgi:hypothetical protein
MRLFMVGFGPLRGMIGMRMIKPDDVFPPLAPFALNSDQFPRIDVIPVVSRVGSGVAAARGRGHKF